MSAGRTFTSAIRTPPDIAMTAATSVRRRAPSVSWPSRARITARIDQPTRVSHTICARARELQAEHFVDATAHHNPVIDAVDPHDHQRGVTAAPFRAGKHIAEPGIGGGLCTVRRVRGGLLVRSSFRPRPYQPPQPSMATTATPPATGRQLSSRARIMLCETLASTPDAPDAQQPIPIGGYLVPTDGDRVLVPERGRRARGPSGGSRGGDASPELVAGTDGRTTT